MVFSSPLLPATAQTEAGEQAVAAKSWRKPVAAFVLLFGLVWLSLCAAYVLLPFVRPGSVVIADAKFETLVKGDMFGPEDRHRVMFFGHSQVLAGLRPRELDAAVGPGFRSYNLGLPGEVRFLPVLEAALEAGNVPTHVLLTLAWDARPNARGWSDALRDDAAIANALFPFRPLPRDATLFLFLNRSRLAEAVHDVGAQRDMMLEDRGWYFIKSQSHSENDQLPDDYALPTDDPARTNVRAIPERSFTRERLEQLAARHGFQILFVPVPFRNGQFASSRPSDDARLATISDRPLIRVLGADYWTYPPALFADPQHVSPRGASAYTRDLAGLLKNSGIFD